MPSESFFSRKDMHEKAVHVHKSFLQYTVNLRLKDTLQIHFFFTFV